MLHPSITALMLLALATTTTAQDMNWRSFGIALRSRPAGSAAGTAYTLEHAVGPTAFDNSSAHWTWDTTAGSTPIPPVGLTQVATLTPTKQYQLAIVGASACTAGFAPNISLGQRLVLDISATFSQPSVVTIGACNLGVEAACGNFWVGWPLPFFYYQNSASQLPWAAGAQGSDNGNSVLFDLAIDYAAPTGILQWNATADVASYQEVPPPLESFGLFWSKGTIDFTVSQNCSVDLAVSSFGPVRGETQFYPLLPIVQPNGFHGRSNWWYDPPMAVGFDFAMTGTSLFTDIMTLPVGIDSDGLFEVFVGDVSLGWFAEGSRVDFRLLLGGNGVPSFRIVGIDPKDATDAMAFPVQLAFDTPEAGFTMTALPWRKIGQSCGDALACPQCPQLTLAPLGDAIEGNANFALGVDHGPTNGAAALFLALGAASSTPAPLFCGHVLLPLSGPVYPVGVTWLTGGGSCGGSGSVPLPLPTQSSLVGMLITAQAVTLCPAGGFGLTHGVEFAVGN